MTAQGETCEVVGAFVHLLHERGVCENQAVLAQHSVDLRDHLRRIEDVFEHRLYPYAVDGFVCEGQLVPVRDDGCVGGPVDVCSDDANPIVLIERGGTIANAATADYQQARRRVR